MRKLFLKIWEGLKEIWRQGNYFKYGNNETPDDTYFAYYIALMVFIFVTFFLMVFLL